MLESCRQCVASGCVGRFMDWFMLEPRFIEGVAAAAAAAAAASRDS